MAKFINLLGILFLLFANTLFAQYNPFKKIEQTEINSEQIVERVHHPEKFQLYKFDTHQFLKWVQEAPELSNTPSHLIISLPTPNGVFKNYWIYNNSVFEGELAEKLPNIKSLKAIDVENKGNNISISISDIFGLHAMALQADGSTFYIDNYTNDLNYVMVYNREDLQSPKSNFNCLVKANDEFNDIALLDSFPIQTYSLDNKRRNYRLALACTVEYANFHINRAPVGTPKTTDDAKKNIVLAAMNVTINRVNQIYENELNVHLNIIANNKNIIFVNTDNFTNNDAYDLIDESQTVITNIIGSNNFDIGHTFSTGAGGLADLGCVCNNWQKASGITGQSSPVGDPFDVDYVAHEMGHQFGAEHTFNNSCQFNRNNFTAYETGSGTTIMSYAGICPPNIKRYVDPYFHYASIKEIQTFLSGATCAQQTTVNNNAPVINSINSYTIPYGTPFILRANATDVDGDQLTYNFEQINRQIATQPPSATNTTGPAFRNYPPSTNNFRSFPNLETVLAGTTNTNGIVSNQWEVLSLVPRSYDFGVVVRDNNPVGGRVVYTQPTTITVANTGPFVITSPNNNPSTQEPVWYFGDTKTITWKVGGTSTGAINTPTVNILISTDDGITFTTLAANTPNDGSEIVTIPNLTNTYSARIKIEAVNNIFYTVSKKFILWDPNLSNDDIIIKDINIYPNPTSNILNIDFTTNDKNDINLSIYDVNGRLIPQSNSVNTTNKNNYQINVSHLKTGTYILILKTDNYTSTHKFVKK